jgi:FKBP-type peptidyl-prolyl cis-trans isomerase 2
MSKYIYFVLLSSLLLACSSTDNANGSGQAKDLEEVLIAKAGDGVSVHYTGTLDNGEQFDSSIGRGSPLEFTAGAGNMISGFDAAVLGMKVGETKTVRLEPKDAYGEIDQDLIIEFPITQLPEGANVGTQVTFSNGSTGNIINIDDTIFIVDANHRLAGKALTFAIELISLDRPPS